MRAFLLIQTDGDGAGLRGFLRDLQDVTVELADDVVGAFDAIALVSAGSDLDLAERVVPALRALPGVTHVLTAPVAGEVAAAPFERSVRAA